MSEQENRGGAAFEEEFSALEQAAPQGGGDMGDTMASPRLQSTRNSRSPHGSPLKSMAAGMKKAGHPRAKRPRTPRATQPRHRRTKRRAARARWAGFASCWP